MTRAMTRSTFTRRKRLTLDDPLVGLPGAITRHCVFRDIALAERRSRRVVPCVTCNCGRDLAMAAAMETTAMKPAAVEATSMEAAVEVVAVETMEAAAEAEADGRVEERASVVVIAGG